MIEFYEENRIGQVLRYLEASKSINTLKLAEKMNVTTRTIRNDIKELNQLLRGTAFIESVSNKYRIFILNQDNFNMIKEEIMLQNDYMNSPTTRCGYILKRLMGEEHPILIDDLAFEMNIGRTTLMADLKRLRGYLEAYDVSIVGKTNNGILLKGNEIHLRFFILENMFDIIYGDYPLDDDLNTMIKEMCSLFHLDKMTSAYFYKSFVVMIDRSLNEHQLASLNEKYYDIKKSKSFNFAYTIAKKVEEYLNIELSTEEYLFLSLPIAGMRTPMNKESRDFFEVSEEVGELIVKILNKISYDMSFNISPTDLLDDFVYHINFMLHRLKYEIRLKNTSLKEVQEKYPLAYKMAEVAKQVIDEETKLVVTDDELGFLASYFGIFLEEQNLAPSQIYCIAILCGSNRITGKLVEVQLKRIMPVNVEYVLVDEQEATVIDLNCFDLIISTVGQQYYTKRPIIYLSEIFDEVEVLRKIGQLKISNRLDFPVKTGLDSLLATCLNPSNFFVLDASSRNHYGTMELVDILIKQNQLKQNFKDKLIERQNKSSMDFGEQLSFPHLICDVEKMVLAIGVIKATKEEKGKIIILLCLPENETVCDDVLMGMYNDVLVISSNEKMINDISKIETGEEFFLYMIRNNEAFE